MDEKRISATEARIHFGELIRKVKEERQPYIVERDGQPFVVLLAVEEYEQLQQRKPGWREALEQARQLREEIAARRGGAPLPDPAEIIREMREERTRQIMEAVGWPCPESEDVEE